MDIKAFIDSLTLDEKKDIFIELDRRFKEGETLQEFYDRIIYNKIPISNRLNNILKDIIRQSADYANFPISRILNLKEYCCLMHFRTFGNKCRDEFIKLRGI